jgi:exonuclease III
MTLIYKVATININGIASPTRLKMLDDFLHQQDIDIALLQEVTQPNFHTAIRYTVHINLGAEGRGTAILTKDGLDISDIKRLPSGRGIAAAFNGTWIFNVYAPSGAEKKTERETFYNMDLLPLLPSTRTAMLIAGDFNCVLHPADSTGHTNYSRALATLVRGFELHDVWDTSRSRAGYSHYTPRSASRLDRIYVSEHLLPRERGVETLALGFTDHRAVALRLALDMPLPVRGRSYWKMNTSYLHETAFREVIKERWTQWQKHKKFYPNATTWWGRYVKGQLRRLFIAEGTGRRRDRNSLENFYYETIYATLRDTEHSEAKYRTLQALRAKIVRLHHAPLQRLLLGTEEQDRSVGETPTLYHALRQKKRKKTQMVKEIRDVEGTLQTSPTAIVRTFKDFFETKYNTIITDNDSIQRIARGIGKKVPPEANTAFESPISMEELHAAIKQGKKGKAPGYDGISHDFFQLSWEVIKNDLLIIMKQMYMDGIILETQTHGTIVCVTKIHKPTSPENYRPLTLVNADKLLSRIIANRLRPWLNDLLHPSQYCGVHGNNIIGALATLRETIAHAEINWHAYLYLIPRFQAGF